MNFKKKKSEEKVEEVPEVVIPKVESPQAEELLETVDETAEVPQDEPTAPEEEIEPQSVEQELFSAFSNLDQRVSKIESVLFRNLN